ncbi:uncharacterized protein JCM15063_004999 [Sporobolomyces koalae]|uniref:uncharacterized protein n=1 Tax=Sporobolomyces koalae TaxID=500713 RepID=UPI003176200A
MRILPGVVGLVLAATTAASSPTDAADYTPIVVPLAVRTPYLGAYLQGRQDKRLTSSDPRFWTGTPLGWKALLRVDGTVWNVMGNLTDYPAAINASFVHTTAESKFTLTDNPPTVALEANFISPVTPADLFRQSIPFSYLHLTVKSLDGNPHDVQVYTEVNGLWLADKEEEQIEWESKGEKDWRGIRFRLRDQRPFTEEQIEKGWTADRILSGDAWYAARASSHVETTFSAGDDAIATRRAFSTRGSLENRSNHTSPRATRTRNDRHASEVSDEPVFAFAHDFGRVSTSTSLESRSQLLVIGHVRDPLVQYMTTGNVTRPLRPLWRSTFTSTEHLISFFLQDFGTQMAMSNAFNHKLYADARKVDGQEYAHIVSISTRQIAAALEAVWDESEEGNDGKGELLVTYSPLTGQPIPTLIMLKEVSSNGNCGTVDVLAPFLPFMVYASPSLIPLLIEPTARYAATGLYTPIPPPHDIGDHYPACIGHNDFLYPGLPIEEAGNMLNMMLAGMRSADPRPYHPTLSGAKKWWDQKRGKDQFGWNEIVGNGKDHRREGARMSEQQARKYWNLLKTWADYLVEKSLFPELQSSTDDFFGPAKNQTSLVIKGITGIRAMSEIASDLGYLEERDYYRRHADEMRDKFLELAVSKDGTHLLGEYGNQSSWMTHYNLYYDKLLNGDVEQHFPQSVYDMQDAFYPTIAQPYGPPLDSRFPARGKTDWLLWAAGASARGSQARRMFVDAVAKYFRADKNAVFGDAITPTEGWSVGFLTRPVTGGHYSLLALRVIEDERTRRDNVRKEWISEEVFYVGIALGFVLVASITWRNWRRKRLAQDGYRELLTTARNMRRRFSSRGGGGEEAIWLAQTPEQGSVFDLGPGDDDDDDDDEEEEWAKRRIQRRSSSIA